MYIEQIIKKMTNLSFLVIYTKKIKIKLNSTTTNRQTHKQTKILKLIVFGFSYIYKGPHIVSLSTEGYVEGGET